MSDSIQPAVLERPGKLTEFSQLTFEVIAGDYSRAGKQPANYTLVRGVARRYWWTFRLVVPTPTVSLQGFWTRA